VQNGKHFIALVVRFLGYAKWHAGQGEGGLYTESGDCRHLMPRVVPNLVKNSAM
jgi:hypothetical protein